MNLKDIVFYRTPLQSLLLRNKLIEYPSLLKVFKKKIILNEHLNFEIKKRLNGIIENFVTILILGKQGTFKTTTGLKFLSTIDASANENNVSFLYEGFNQLIKNSIPKQAFQLDEQIIMHGSGTNRVVDELQNLIETLRKRQNSMIIVGVEGKYFPEGLFTFVMETIDSCIMGTCKNNMVLHEIRDCPYDEELNHIPLKLYVRLAVRENERFIGLYIQEIDWKNELWQKYDLKKVDFMNKATSQDFMKIDYEKIAMELLKNPRMKIYKSVKDIKILLSKEYPNITSEESDLLARQIKLMKLEAENGMINPLSEDETQKA